MYMQKRAIVSTVIIALVFMGCPPPAGHNPNDSASEVNDSAQSGNAPPPIRKHHVAYVSSGSNHTMILKTDDSLWAVGHNVYGQLGDGSITGKFNPVQVMEMPVGGGPARAMANVKQVSSGKTYTMIVKKNDTLWAVGDNSWGQLGDGGKNNNELNPIHIMNDVVQVSSGKNHTVILKKNDTLWAVGDNCNMMVFT